MIVTDFADLFRCKCEPQYTIEPHGDGYALYFGRCNHKHGWNLVYLKEPSANCDLKHIEALINFGAEQYKKTFVDRDYNERFRTVRKSDLIGGNND